MYAVQFIDDIERNEVSKLKNIQKGKPVVNSLIALRFVVCSNTNTGS